MPESIGAIIQEWLRANNLDQKVQEQSVPGYWEQIVGEAMAKHARVDRIEKGRMFVKVESAVWRTEIAIRREEIRGKVNEHFGEEIITEIIVR